jgi:hypothetical protein
MVAWSQKLLIVSLLMSSYGAMGGRKDVPPDPHRPWCTTPECRTIKSFLKQHYCGESPFANGPADGCDIRTQKRFGSPQIKAEPQCDSDDGGSRCRQNGEVQPDLRAVAIRQMRRLGLPAAESDGFVKTLFSGLGYYL